jgi:hypothetical protein
MSLTIVITVVAATVGVFLLVAAGMAIGVMFGRRPISGSCGGLGSTTGPDGKSSCSLCQNPAEACKELQRRAEQGSQGK